MVESRIEISLVLLLVVTAVSGVLAVILKQPAIIGYILAGVVVGPFTPGPRADSGDLAFLAEIGVALLLFVTGSTLAPSRFRGLGKIILLGGAGQIGITILLGLALMPLFNLGVAEGILIGAILAQTSSVVISKILQDRQEVDSIHGRIAIGISIVQDLSSVPLLLLLLVFLGGDAQTVPSLLLAVVEVLLLAALVIIVGRLLWPRILGWIETLGSRELALITTLALALGSAFVVESIGLSFALGAFLAGVVVAESPQSRSAVARVIPLRDAFAAMFFVSIGTLVNPAIIVRDFVPLIALCAAAILGKGLISMLVIRALRAPVFVSVSGGVLLAQLGEFAFILADIGWQRNAISQDLFSLIISAAAISIFLNPLLYRSVSPVLAYVSRTTGLRVLVPVGERGRKAEPSDGGG